MRWPRRWRFGHLDKTVVELRQVGWFAVVAEAYSITRARAAEARAARTLEAEMDVPLFDRYPRGVKPEASDVFLERDRPR